MHKCNLSQTNHILQGLAPRMQVTHKMQVFRKRNTTILGDIQKTYDITTNIFIIKEKKMTTNNYSYFYMDMKKITLVVPNLK